MTRIAGSLLAHGVPAAAALTGGYHLAFWIATGLVIAAAAVAATMLRPRPEPAAAPCQPAHELVTAGRAD